MREKALLAGFAAEAQTPMMMGDKTQSSTTFRGTICFDAHRCTSNFERLRLNAGRLYREMAAELMARNVLWLARQMLRPRSWGYDALGGAYR
jgi:hypothetical protein